jgi:hypothetical protein
MELACTASLKVTVTGADTATPVALLAGVWLVTEGGALSVEKDQETVPLIVSPAVSFTPVMAALYVPPYPRAEVGAKVAVLFELL